jgi:hypothetical protein
MAGTELVCFKMSESFCLAGVLDVEFRFRKWAKGCKFGRVEAIE